MRKTILSLLLLLTVSMVYSQDIPGVDAKKRKEYLMKTYRIHSLKVEAYDKILLDLQRDNDLLKSKKMTSQQFRAKQRKLFEKYGDRVSQAFSKGRYRSWNQLFQNNERYLVLSETQLVPREVMRKVYTAERECEGQRDRMLASSAAESEKWEQREILLEKLNNEICQLLGNEVGNWYIAYREREFNAYSNMDKYAVSYKQALAITDVERTYRLKKAEIFKSGKKNADKEVDFINNEQEKERAIYAALPADVANRWKRVNNAVMDNILTRKYGLTPSQITDFKKAYSRYAIGEYNINRQKKLSVQDKHKQLAELNTTFQETVRPLFSAKEYLKWQGWWVYKYNKKMERKGGKL